MNLAVAVHAQANALRQLASNIIGIETVSGCRANVEILLARIEVVCTQADRLFLLAQRAACRSESGNYGSNLFLDASLSFGNPNEVLSPELIVVAVTPSHVLTMGLPLPFRPNVRH